MFTGEDDISKVGMLQLWNGETTAGLYRGNCDKVQGTTGELWPPRMENNQKTPGFIFATDVCRTLKISYESDYSIHGVKGYKWIADESVLDNGNKYPEMECFCSADKESCPDLLPGVFNASSCKFGSPAFVSFPHFYLADEDYRNKIEGMNPSKEKHQFSISMEPRTGIPLDIQAKLQINILMKSYPWTPITGVPNMMIPMFWFQVCKLVYIPFRFAIKSFSFCFSKWHSFHQIWRVKPGSLWCFQTSVFGSPTDWLALVAFSFCWEYIAPFTVGGKGLKMKSCWASKCASILNKYSTRQQLDAFNST